MRKNNSEDIVPLQHGKSAKRRKFQRQLNLKKLKLNKDHFSTKRDKPKETKSRLSSQSDSARRKNDSTINNNHESNFDDQTIHRMEKLMKIKRKTNNKPKLPSSFYMDGLDYLLDVVDHCDEVLSGGESDCSNSGDSDKPVEITHHKKVKFQLEKINKIEEKFDDVSHDGQDISSDKSENLSEEDEEIALEKQVVDDETQECATECTADSTTDNSNGKYVPPSLRNRNLDHGESKTTEMLKRQVKGLLNRLSEANMHKICGELENIYQNNSRAIVTLSLTDLILTQFNTSDPIPDRLITESSMLITIMSNNIGQELVAHFLEITVKMINKLLLSKEYGTGKECNNLIQLVCSLFQISAIQKQVVTDVIEIFFNSFEEKDVELLVLILQKIGFQLRKEDPIFLKALIEKITSKSRELKLNDSSRMKFMLELLMAIKNNNVRKVLGYDADTVAARRKKVKMLSLKQSESFPDVTFEDLVNAETKGRWWIVGSAWGGLPMLKNKPEVRSEAKVSAELLKAAKKLRMNTDVRRKIFFAVMSSEDFNEAFHNVLQLGLKAQQLREVGSVVLECCQKERSFNPFYFHLLKKLCFHDRQFIMSIQCSFWDRFKLISRLSSQQVDNVVMLLSKLILSTALPLSCLKTIEYSEIDKPTVLFLKNVFSLIATEAKLTEIDAVFEKLSHSKHNGLKNGLRLFLQHFMLKDDEFMKNNKNIENSLQRMDARLDSQKSGFLYNSFN